MEAQILLQPVEYNVEEDIHTAVPGGPHAATSGYALKDGASSGELMKEQAPGRSCSLWKGAPKGAGFLAGAVGLYGRLTFEQFVKNCLPWKGPHTGEG